MQQRSVAYKEALRKGFILCWSNRSNWLDQVDTQGSPAVFLENTQQIWQQRILEPANR